MSQEDIEKRETPVNVSPATIPKPSPKGRSLKKKRQDTSGPDDKTQPKSPSLSKERSVSSLSKSATKKKIGKSPK